MKLILPYPPSVNHYWRHVGSKTLVSREGLDYRQRVGQAVLEQQGCMPYPLQKRCTVTIVAHMPDNRRRDLDNLLKALLDALVKSHVILDDELIDFLSISRGPVGAGTVEVTILEVP